MRTQFYKLWRSVVDIKPSLRIMAANMALLLTIVASSHATSVTTISGGLYYNGHYYGYSDGPTFNVARYHTPCGLALDNSGNYLFVADRDNNAIRYLEFDNGYTWTLTTNLLDEPIAVTVEGSMSDYSLTAYVLNHGNGNNGTILEFDLWGDLLATYASNLTNACGMALDSNGNIYVTVQSNKLISIAAGTTNQTTVATITNSGTSLQGITIRHDGLIAACDSGNNGIWLINPFATNSYSPLAGFHGKGDFPLNGNDQSPSNNAAFFQPMNIVEAGNGDLIFSDYGNNRIKVILPNGIVTNLCGVSSNYWTQSYYPGWSDGTPKVPDSVAGNVQSRMPYGIVFGLDGTIYTSEDYYHIIRKITGTGIAPPLPLPPAAPASLSATTNYGQVNLTWSTVTGATNYNVKRSTSSGAETTIASTTSTNYIDTNVIDGTTYYYVVSAVNSGGEGPSSAEVSVTLPIRPPPAPRIGWFDYEGSSIPFTTVLHPVSGAQFITPNDLFLAIDPNTGGANSGIATIYTTDGSDPSTNNGSTPPAYADGLTYAQPLPVAASPDLIIKAINVNAGGSSAIVTAEFVFRVGNPSIIGTNAAQFQISDVTAGAHLYYTLDGSDPSPTNYALNGDLGTVSSPTNFWTVGFPIQTNTLFRVRAYRDNYAASAIVSNLFLATNFLANTISFGFSTDEASSDFVGAPGQIFYAPVTLTTLSSTKIYSLQFNITVTNKTGSTPVIPGTYSFGSMLLKPDVDHPGLYVTIPPYSFVSSGSDLPPPTDTNIVIYQGNFYQDLEFQNTALNLIGVGWIERYGSTNLYNTESQDLITYSQAHDLLYPNTTHPDRVEVGGYAFLIPPTATSNDVYQIQIARPSATSDGIGANGSSVYIAAPTNGATGGGAPVNALKYVTIGQKKYIVGSVTPFRWFNAGDFGSSNIVNADVEQVFQSAAYALDTPPPGSDFFDAMDSCGNFGVLDSNPNDANYGYYTNASIYPKQYYYTITNYTYVIDSNNTVISTNATVVNKFSLTYLTSSAVIETYTNIYIYQATSTTNYVPITVPVHISAGVSTLFDGNDTNINQIAFGDGRLDVCDVYVTFRRSLDPSLVWFRRFWNNGQLVADTGAPNISANSLASKTLVSGNAQSNVNVATTTPPQVIFTAGDIVGSAGQTVQIPVNATVLGSYPLRVLMLNLDVTPLDGSPALTSAVQFTPSAALGQPQVSDSKAVGNYAAAWLNSTIAGLSGTANIGVLNVTIPSNASGTAAYAIHFDEASGSPNGLASFPKQTVTGLITTTVRTNSYYNDGIPDSWRLRWFGTIYNVLSESNACPSGDGVDNWEKYVAGVDPNTPNDFPSVNAKSSPPSGHTAAIYWPSVTGKQYVIERSSSLFPGNWTAISTNTGTGGDLEYDDSNTGPSKFYRVRILPP